MKRDNFFKLIGGYIPESLNVSREILKPSLRNHEFLFNAAWVGFIN